MTPTDIDPYRPIADYGIIGDTCSAALVSTAGAVDWCCWPRFDSPAIFNRLLDAEDGGYFAITPVADFDVDRRYIDETNVLETTFSTASGEVELTDLMPLDNAVREADRTSKSIDSSRRILRRIRGVSGTVDVRVAVRPSFDWGRNAPQISEQPWGIRAEAGEQAVAVVGDVDLAETGDGALAAIVTVEADQQQWICVEYLEDGDPRPESLAGGAAGAALADTVSYWRGWSRHFDYDGRWAHMVQRSALTLKLLTYSPTGAIVAAPTTSLPEQIGGVRNWDYRFVWLRDAGLTLRALQEVGYSQEATSFWKWLEGLDLGESHEMQNIYRIDGGTELAEHTLDHLAGYADSKPVRVGNGAAGQLQLDRYGHILGAAHLYQADMQQPDPSLKPVLRFLAHRALDRWKEPDHGIWEMRSEPQHYVYSKLRCWVGLDRAVRLVDRGWLSGDVDRWRDGREQIRDAIIEHGYNDQLGSFTQTFDGDNLDASVLVIPQIGFLPATDSRFQSTLACLQEHLVADGMVKRYVSDDGLPAGEGSFVMCTFWLVGALADSGRDQEAHDLFEHTVSYANDLGLLSEEIDPDDDQLLGNFPQAFSHLALIDAALRLCA